VYSATCAFRGHRSRAGSFASAPIQNPDPLYSTPFAVTALLILPRQP
jgi:hypothetical protein